MNSRAPARMAFTINCGCEMGPNAKMGVSGIPDAKSRWRAGLERLVGGNIDENHIGVMVWIRRSVESVDATGSCALRIRALR